MKGQTNAGTKDQAVLVDKKRFAEFEVEPGADYRTVVREVDMGALAEADMNGLNALIRAFGRQQADFMQFFHRREYRRYCCGSQWMRLRDAFVSQLGGGNPKIRLPAGTANSMLVHGLQARQWKMALQVAAGIVGRYWRAVQRNSRSRIWGRNVWQSFTEAERHYVNLLLCDLSERFFDLLDGKIPAPTPKILKKGAISRPRQLCSFVLSIVRETQGCLPAHGVSRSVWFDQECWASRGAKDEPQVLGLMSLLKGKRIFVRLKGTGRISGTVMLVKSGDSFKVHVLQKVKPKRTMLPKSCKQLKVISADMGMTEVFTDNSGRQYGHRLGKLIKAYAEAQEAKLRERNRFTALARNISKAAGTCIDPAQKSRLLRKRRRILKFNLGRKKWDAVTKRFRTAIENCVNHALNRMLGRGDADGVIVESFGQVFRLDGVSKKMRNRLSRWVRGLIDERLAFKAVVFGKRLAKVPAAYSSQSCPVCHCVTRRNRHGDRFRCRHCRHKGHADKIAAGNLLDRVNDPFFKRWSGKNAIKAHLRELYEQWCINKKEQPLSQAQLDVPVRTTV